MLIEQKMTGYPADKLIDMMIDRLYDCLTASLTECVNLLLVLPNTGLGPCRPIKTLTDL